MSPWRRHSFNLRVPSPEPISRIPTPPHLRVRTRPTTSYQPDWEPVRDRLPPPPRRQVIQTSTVYRADPSFRSRVYNLFHPSPRRVAVVETPIRRTQSTRYHHPPSPPLPRASSHKKYSVGGHLPARPPNHRFSYGMSPTNPPAHVPMPEVLPPVDQRPVSHGPGIHQRSRSRDSSGRRRPAEYYPDPWHQAEQPNRQDRRSSEEPDITTQSPVRANPNSREERLARENRRLSRDLQDSRGEAARYQRLAVDLQEQLDQAITSSRGDRDRIESLNLQLAECNREIEYWKASSTRRQPIIHQQDTGVSDIRDFQNNRGGHRDNRGPNRGYRS